MELLFSNLKSAGLIDEMGNIILERYDDGMYQSVDVETFAGFFGATDSTHAKLVAADGGKGYKRFFDDWKAQGIL